MPTDPKTLLGIAEKKIASAKEIAAQNERLERLKQKLEKEQATLIDSADVDSRPQMKELGEISGQLLVIPRRLEKAAENQKQAGIELLDTVEELHRAIQALHAEEIEKRLDEIEAVFAPYFTLVPETHGNRPNRAREIAKGADIFGVLQSSITPKTSLPAQGQSACHNEPREALQSIITHAEELQVILAAYFANRKSFSPSASNKVG